MDSTTSFENGSQWDELGKKHPIVPEASDYGMVFMIIVLGIYLKFKRK